MIRSVTHLVPACRVRSGCQTGLSQGDFRPHATHALLPICREPENIQCQTGFIQWLGDQLKAAEAELAKHYLTTLPTSRLLAHVESLQRRLQKEAGLMRFITAVDAVPDDEYADRIQVWNP